MQYSDNLVQDIDLIILGGYYGQGKYTGIVKSFMMGVAVAARNERENPSQFLSVVSVSSGIGDQMLHHLQTRFASYWTKKRPENVTGPVKVNITHIHVHIIKIILLFMFEIYA